LEQLFVYVVIVSDISKTELNKAIDSIPPNIKDDIMTTYSRIREEEKQVGIQIGKLEGKIEVVQSLHDDFIAVEQIAKYTKLSVEEVVNILREHKKPRE